VTLTAAAGVPCTQTYALRAGELVPRAGLRLRAAEALQLAQVRLQPRLRAPLSTILPGPNKWNASTQSLSSLLTLNPALNCSQLMGSQQVCVSAAQGDANTTDALDCGLTYTTVDADTCKSVASAFGLKVKAFSQLNPGFDCSKKNKPMGAGFELCVADASSKVRPPPPTVAAGTAPNHL